MEYPKIETLYERDMQTFKVMPDKVRLPEFLLVNRWHVTEKIDGTNVRIRLTTGGPDPSDPWPGGSYGGVPGVSYSGRTDKADMPKHLLTMLTERFPYDKVAAAFDPDTEAIIFGEGYGPKIQRGGGNYAKEVSFRVFDVVVFGANGRPWWLNWEDVEDVARKIGANTVPVLNYSIDFDEAPSFLHTLHSTVAAEEGQAEIPPEGIVARTNPLLFTRAGQRVMWKLKRRDF